ncbi:XkdF-like putative serine protease domain-containing protein [Candidatus Pacearchaeota archaeon]|jgi:hypothetical protein|nr:XkdF-like putative serine protease domain-containing protein [Candidatus Pacearchaeota archaeon]
MSLDRKNYLKNITPVEVSICGTPMVPGAVIALIKSAEAAIAGLREANRLTKSVTFLGKDEMKKQVYAYVLIPDDADREGDVVTKEEVEKACDNFGMVLSDKRQKGTGAGDSHEVFEDIAKIAQSCVDVDGSLGKALGFAKSVAGAWLVKFQIVSDEVWKGILDGTYTGVSMGAFAEREPIPAGKSWSFGKAIKEFFAKHPIAKDSADFDSTYSLQRFYDESPEMMNALENSLWSIIYDETTSQAEKAANIVESFDQCRDAFVELFNPATKSADKSKIDKTSGDPAAEGEQEMKPEDVQKMLDAALAPILKSIGDLKTELTTQFNEVKKSAETKLEETEFGKSVSEDIDRLTTMMTDVKKRVWGSNALENQPSAADIAEKEKTEKAAQAQKEKTSGTAFGFSTK